MRRIDLHRVVLAESAGPLTIVAMSSAAAGQLVAAVVLIAAGRQRTYELPPLSYWLALMTGCEKNEINRETNKKIQGQPQDQHEVVD